MSTREFYFRTLGRMTSALSAYSDPLVADGFKRLNNLFRLMDLRTASGDAPTIDLVRSGLPILREVISVCNDLEDAPKAAPGVSSQELRDAMLDEMLVRRRLPDERMVGGMARALYREEVARMQPAQGARTQVFQADASRSFKFDLVESDGTWVAVWDFWDGTGSRAIVVEATFQARVAIREEIDAVNNVAGKFSGVGFSPLSLATEIDEVTRNLRLVKLRKVIVGPFLSEIFSKVDDPVMDAMKASDDIEDAWAVRWTVDTVVSAGTKMVGGGLFKAARPRQNFVVTLTDPDCAMRSVTSVERHAAMPHGMFQRLASQRHECSSLKDSAIHVLSGDHLLENA